MMENPGRSDNKRRAWDALLQLAPNEVAEERRAQMPAWKREFGLSDEATGRLIGEALVLEIRRAARIAQEHIPAPEEVQDVACGARTEVAEVLKAWDAATRERRGKTEDDDRG